MPRAPKAPGHSPPGPWLGSTRSQTLGPGHRAWRESVLKRAGYRCEWEMPDGSKCGAKANQGDHVIRGEDRGQALCVPHHASKSGREGAEARIAKHGF